MLAQFTLVTTLFLSLAVTGPAEEHAQKKPVELQALRATLGVWDAEVEVWPEGLDAASVEFSGVETNRAYGEYWIASDFVSDFQGQAIKVHTIVGYDLDERSLVGMAIDHGPYASRMTGNYEEKSKTVHWTTKVKAPDGTLIEQRTTTTQKSPHERALVLSLPNKETGEFVKFMQIKLLKRAKAPDPTAE